MMTSKVRRSRAATGKGTVPAEKLNRIESDSPAFRNSCRVVTACPPNLVLTPFYVTGQALAGNPKRRQQPRKGVRGLLGEREARAGFAYDQVFGFGGLMPPPMFRSRAWQRQHSAI
jgi:hypothetical protein